MKSFTIILFTLPDGSFVLQRRTHDAPYAPDKLGIFGGWVEEGETPEACIRREIKEETSLPVDRLDIKFLKDFVIPRSEDFKEDRHFYLFSTELKVPISAYMKVNGRKSLHQRNRKGEMISLKVRASYLIGCFDIVSPCMKSPI